MDTLFTNKKGKKGCLGIIIIAVVFFGLWAIFGKDSAPENYNDNSSFHQIIAKNYLKDYLIDNLKDAKSYEEVDYSSQFNTEKGCYEVMIKYRARNSFGAFVLERVTGDIYFVEDNVSIRNVKTE